eukprot:g21383.t1
MTLTSPSSDSAAPTPLLLSPSSPIFGGQAAAAATSLDLCAALFSLLEQLGHATEGTFIREPLFQDDKGTLHEAYTLKRLEGKHGGRVEVVRHTELRGDLDLAAETAREAVRHETEKRQQDVIALDKDIANLLTKIEEAGDDVDELGRQVSQLTMMKGRHKKRIAHLEALLQLEVCVELRKTETALVIDLPEEKTTLSREKKMVPKKAVLPTGLYVVGGMDGNRQALASVEQFDADARAWTSCHSLSTPRDMCAVATCGEFLYVMGGGRLSSVERLPLPERKKAGRPSVAPALQRWEQVSSLLSFRAGAAAGVLDGQIYVVGGHDGISFLSSVERYRPGVSGLSSKWERVASMNQKRYGCAVAVHVTNTNRATLTSTSNAHSHVTSSGDVYLI